MANENGDGTSVLAFILGGAIVVIAVLGFFFYTGGHRGTGGSNVHVTENTTHPH